MSKIEPFYTSLGRNIQEMRDSLGLSQSALGQRLIPQVTRASIANIEAGKQRVLAHTLVQLASALGTNLSNLVPKNGDAQQLTDYDFSRAVEEELLLKEVLPPDMVKQLTTQITNLIGRSRTQLIGKYFLLVENPG